MPQPEVINPQLCVALYDNSSDSPDELSFKADDILIVVDQDAPGLEGWWICSAKGRQGICPSNRLRLMSEFEQSNVKKKNPKGKEEPYDMPQPVCEQYDVPPAAVSAAQEESYDVPKPVGSLTPSSSISSLTTDSNRSSLIQQEYDVPRPSRLMPQCVYDVPRSGEISLDMTSALEWLGRLESDVTGSISRLLALATLGWRSKSKLEPRLIEIRGLITKLSSSLHDLTIFTHSVLARHHDSGLGVKLNPLVTALTKAEMEIRECTQKLDSIGWNINILAVEDQETKSPDMLDSLIQCVAALTDDIRAIASFIQGNSTLLFKRSTPQPTPEDVRYMNTGVEVEETKEPEKEALVLSTEDKKVVEMYAGFYWTQANCLAQAIDAFLATVTQNQPPKAFLARCKGVVMAASRLLLLGESIERSLQEGKTSGLKGEAIACNRFMNEFITALVNKTKSAAVQFPSVKAVQKMVDAVVELSRPPDRFKHSLLAARMSSA